MPGTQDPATVMPGTKDPATMMPRTQDHTTTMSRTQDHAYVMTTDQDPITTMPRAQNATPAIPRVRDPAITILRAQDPSTAPMAQDPSTAPRAQGPSTASRAQDPSNVTNCPPPFVFLGPRHPTIFYPKKLMFRAPGEMPLRFPPGVLLPNSSQQSQFYNSRQLRPSRHQQPPRPNPQQPTRPSNPQQPQKTTTLQQAPRLSNRPQTSRFSNPQLSLYLPNPARSRHQRPTSAPGHHQSASFHNQIHQPMFRASHVPHQSNLQTAQQGDLQAAQYHLNMSNSPQSYINSKPTGIKEELDGLRNVGSSYVNSTSPVPVIRRILPPPMLNNPPISENSPDIVAMGVDHHVEIELEQFHLIKSGQELARMCFAVEVGCQTDLSFPLDKEVVLMPVQALTEIPAPLDDKSKIEQDFVPGSYNIAKPGDSIAEDSNKTVLEENAFQDQETLRREHLMKDHPDISTENSVIENKIKCDNDQSQTKVEAVGNLNLTFTATNSQKVQHTLQNLNRDKSFEEIFDTDTINTDSKISKVKSENSVPKAASENIDTSGQDVEEKASSFNPLSNFATLMSLTSPYIKTHLSDVRFDASTSSSTQVLPQRNSENGQHPQKDQLAIPNPQISSLSIQKNVTGHANMEKQSSYASAIICRNPKYEDALSENSSKSSDMNHRLANKKSSIECSNTSGRFLVDSEDPQPSTSKRLCQSGFTKSRLKSPMDRLQMKDNFGNPKPDVVTRMTCDQFEESAEGEVSTKQRPRNVSQGISQTWNLSLLEALTATERRDCIPGITSLKRDNVQNETIQTKLLKDSENVSPVKIEKEIMLKDTVKVSPIEKEILIQDTVENNGVKNVARETEKNCLIGTEKESIMKPSPYGFQKQPMTTDTVETSPVQVEKLIKDTENATPLGFQNESVIKDMVEKTPLKVEDGLIKDTESNSSIGSQNESMIKNIVESIIMDTVETSPGEAEERLVKDIENTGPLCFKNESVIKDTVEISPVNVGEECPLSTENSSPIDFQNESMIKDTVQSSTLKVEGKLIKDTDTTSPSCFQNGSTIRDRAKGYPVKVEEAFIKNAKNKPIGFKSETSIEDMVKISPVKIQKECVIINIVKNKQKFNKGIENTSPVSVMSPTEKSSPIRIDNESVIKNTGIINPDGIGKKCIINDNLNESPVQILKETVSRPIVIQKKSVNEKTVQTSQKGLPNHNIIKKSEEIKSPIRIQRISVIKDTKTIPVRIQKQSVIKAIVKTSPIRVQMEDVIEESDDASTVTIQKEGTTEDTEIQKEGTTEDIEIQKESVINISDYEEIQEKRSSRGRILKKRKFDDYNDCSTDSDDEEEGNSPNMKCQNLCSSKIVENKVILSTRKSIDNTMLEKSPVRISIIHPINEIRRNLQDVEFPKGVITDLEDHNPDEDDEKISVEGIPQKKSRNLTKVNTMTRREKTYCERGDRVLRSASKVNIQFISAENKKTKEMKEMMGKGKRKLFTNDHKKIEDEGKVSKRKSKVTKQLQKVFDEVIKDPASADFYYNVTEPRPMPRYYIIEGLEIDLKTVELKLENGLYTDVEEFLQDFKNIAKTSVDYFGPTHKISKKSGKLLDLACGLLSRRNLSLATDCKSDLMETVNNDSNNTGNPTAKNTKRKTLELTETTLKKKRNDSRGFVCEECGTMFAYFKGFQRHSRSKSACANALRRVAGHSKACKEEEVTDHQTETKDKSRRSHSAALGVDTQFAREGLNQTSKVIKKTTKIAAENASDDHIEVDKPKCGREKQNEEGNSGSFSQTPPSPSAASSLQPLSRRKSLPKKNCGFVPAFPRGVQVSHPQDNIVVDADDDNFEPPGLLVRSLVDVIPLN